jgi:hypothetical protein
VRVKAITAIFFLLCAAVSAQDKVRRLSTTIPDAEFPRFNADGSATFRVQADSAQKVELLMN